MLAPRDSAQSPSVLRLQPLGEAGERGASPAGQSSLLSHGWVPTLPSPGLVLLAHRADRSPDSKAGLSKAFAGFRQYLWEEGRLHCKLSSCKAPSSMLIPHPEPPFSMVYHRVKVACMITTWKRENIPPKSSQQINPRANLYLLSPSCARSRAGHFPFMASFNPPKHPGAHFIDEEISERFTGVMEATQTE